MIRNSFLNNQIWNAFILTAAIIYVMIMIKLLFLRGTGHLYSCYSYNVIPFNTIKQYIVNRDHFNPDIWVKNLFGNIVLFIPLGIFGPLLNVRLLRLTLFLESVISILFCVELIQLFTKVGSFDIDDIILNTFGAMIGLTCIRLFKYTARGGM
jgi:glycopeptide antibiotics resistance protein